MVYDSWAAPIVAVRAHRFSLRYVRFEGARWGAADISIELSIKEEGAVRHLRGQVRPVDCVPSGTASPADGTPIAFDVNADGTFVVSDIRPGLITLELGPAVIDELEIE